MSSMEKLILGVASDILFFRDPDDSSFRITNLTKYINTSDDFEWGYAGTGPHCFAQNILYHFTKNFEYADEKKSLFVMDVITNLPRAGGRILATDILEWIRKNP